ncbi:MAG: thiamine pyrophosphate-binding protein [Candidatus Tectomicrobia bacterium]|nr:thiamine pyrophosphate-binding protein [Candidatus Tectomicrobia bacterium]
MPRITGGRAVVERLLAHGVRHVFGLPGSSVQDVLDALVDRPQIDFILALQEGSLISMADGYARACGRPAFVLVHMLPGTANLVGGLYNARRDGSPLVVASGQQDTRLLGRGAFTDTSDMVEVVRQFTKWAWEVPRADRMAEAVDRALYIAMTPPRGPVYLALPKDLLHEEAEIPLPVVHPPPAAFGPDPEAADRAAAALLAAERPLIVCGSGVFTARAVEDLVELADLLAAPVVSEPWNAFLSFPTAHPLSFGRFSAESPLYRRADVLLGVGARLFMEADFAHGIPRPPGARLIQCHEDATELGKTHPVDIALLCDARSGLRALLARLRSRVADAERRDHLAKEQESRRAEMGELRREGGSRPVKPWRLVQEIDAVKGSDGVVVDDSITGRGYLETLLTFERPAFFSVSSGCIGWGLPAALGVQLAWPDRRVFACCGDGSLVMSVQALWTAARYRLPVVAVVFNNRGYVSVKAPLHWLEGRAAKTGTYFGVDLTPPDLDFIQLAKGFGVAGRRVEDPEEIRSALEEALAAGEPRLVEVLTDPRETGYGLPPLPAR